jgi:hypothetical protein
MNMKDTDREREIVTEMRDSERQEKKEGRRKGEGKGLVNMHF